MASSSSDEVRVAARRIVDYLNDGEELGIEGVVETPPPPPPLCSPAAAVAVAAGEATRSALPRFRWPRLVRLGRKGGGGKRKVGEEAAVVAEKVEQPPPVPAVSTSACEPAAATGTATRNSDLGVSLSLVFLLAKTSDEFNKMVKVRAEMEALLQEMRHQVRETSGGNGHGHDVPKPPDPVSTTSSCVTDRNEQGPSARMEDHQGASSSVDAASCGKSSGEEGAFCAGVDVLEEEFHAEMERLQVTYGSETPSFLPEDEDDDHYSEPYDEVTDYRQGFNDDLGEAVEDDEDNDDYEPEYNGVSAIELERRLHELLHERNRDRIQELEAALRCAEKKLFEKEMEVSLWKDTAKLALRQDDEPQ